MARFGGLFHLCQSIPNAFKEKRRFDKALQEFRLRLLSPVKNSTAQNWHKAAQNLVTQTRSVRTESARHDSPRADDLTIGRCGRLMLFEILAQRF
jgi:hypothetical protein